MFSSDMFFDLHVHGNDSVIKEAERLGYAGIAVTRYLEEYNSEFKKEFKDLRSISNITLKKGLEITCKNPQDMKKKVQKSRKISDILIVQGGDLKINRAACEDSRVDVLSQPYRSRRDSGINHILARKAAQNDVAIEINLKYLLKNNPRYRYRIISQFRHTVELQRKFKFPLIITSDSTSKYDLRTPQDLIALGKCFEMTPDEVFGAISTIPNKIIEANNSRDSFVVEGVRTV
jgi:ribonuclease P/MRP protein subunit RPP1